MKVVLSIVALVLCGPVLAEDAEEHFPADRFLEFLDSRHRERKIPITWGRPTPSYRQKVCDFLFWESDQDDTVTMIISKVIETDLTEDENFISIITDLRNEFTFKVSSSAIVRRTEFTDSAGQRKRRYLLEVMATSSRLFAKFLSRTAPYELEVVTVVSDDGEEEILTVKVTRVGQEWRSESASDSFDDFLADRQKPMTETVRRRMLLCY